LRVVEGQLREGGSKRSLKGSERELQKLRRDRVLFLGESRLKEIHTERRWCCGKYSGGRESTVGKSHEVCEIPRIIRSRGSHAGVNP
jgi:hypothetical protein